MATKIHEIYSSIINAGLEENEALENKYRLISINKFCFFCILISSPYLLIFLAINMIAPYILILCAHILFALVVYLNHKRLYSSGKFLLLTTTALSVLFISLMLGFNSGFHLYLYTAPLFVFWLFDIKEVKNIVLAVVIYSIVYISVFIFKYYTVPFYQFDFRIIGLDMYSLNMGLNLVLLFLLFYNYSTYYKILSASLIQKQKHLESEINKRIESDDNTKKIFQELSKSYSSLEQFSFIVSHNMKSPLANIKGFLSLYDKEGVDIELNRKVIGYIENSTVSLDDTLSDLNYILRSQKKILDKREDILLKDLVNNIKISLATEIISSGIEVFEKYDEDLKLNSIRSILHSVFFNLVQNAIKFKRDNIKSTIIISVEQDSEQNIIKITDNGIGIDLQKNEDRIFNLYNRFNANIEGKGIGLYLVKNHLEMLGGTIEVASIINEGTVFSLKIKK